MLDVLALAQTCAPQVAPATIAALTRHESRHNPFAININGPYRLQRQPRTLAEALDAAARIEKLGASFDVGLGQINSKNLNRLGYTVAEALDPCTNLRLASIVLTDCYLRGRSRLDGQARLQAALSCYNTGNPNAGFRNGYVASVYRSATRDNQSY